MRVTIESNVDDVIGSIDDVKDDLRKEFRKRLTPAMAMLQARAKRYVQDDADWTGALAKSIELETDTGSDLLTFEVFQNDNIAPHGPLVEYGTGDRGNPTQTMSMSQNVGGEMDRKPPDYPYDSPSIDYNSDNAFDLTGYSNFAALVGAIENWVKTKPIEPRKGDTFTAAVAIARSIIENGTYGHPYMRPAWFKSELKIKRAAENALKSATR